MNKLFRVLGVLAAAAMLPVGTPGLAVAQAAKAPSPIECGRSRL